MNTIDVMECGEISCEYCNKDKCVYMTSEKSDVVDKKSEVKPQESER